MRTNHNWPGLWLGLILVAVGSGLVAREFGLLPPQVRVLDFWPLVVVFVGISVLLRRRGFVSSLLALGFIGLGGVLLAANLGFLASAATRLWPLLVVLFGVAVLLRGGRGPDRHWPGPRPPFGRPPRADSPSGESELGLMTDPDRLSRQYTCSGAELRIESQAWKGGELAVTAGGVELDLRQARLDPEGAVLALRVLMGGVDIRVPDTWSVEFDVVPFIGGADNSTRSTQGTGTAPRLRIVGAVTLGGVSVQN